jgi:hypothetical protein
MFLLWISKGLYLSDWEKISAKLGKYVLILGKCGPHLLGEAALLLGEAAHIGRKLHQQIL